MTPVRIVFPLDLDEHMESIVESLDQLYPDLDVSGILEGQDDHIRHIQRDFDAQLYVLDNWEDAVPMFELHVGSDTQSRVFQLKGTLQLKLDNLKHSLG